MNYTLIGTGNMAYFISSRLNTAGWTCNGIWSRNRESASELANKLDTEVIIHLKDISDENDVCIMAISDDAINEVSKQLLLEKTVVIHTAGSVSLDAVVQHNKAVLWPVYSILKNDLPLLTNIPIICEANTSYAKEVTLKLANAVSQNVQFATFEKRQWMHLIAAFTNNFTNHIIAIGEQISKEQDIDFDIFAPIVKQTFERISTNGAFNSQTGAAKRDDDITLQKHKSLLNPHPYWQIVYNAISDSIKDLYSGKGK